MNEKVLHEINTNIRYILLILALDRLPEETKYASLKKMGFTAVEISALTAIPESTIKRWWNPKNLEENKKNGKSK